MGIRGKLSIPAGIIQPFAGATIPAGWLACAGQAVSRTAYAGLFLAIGTTYGAGDGATTFNLPDARGRALFGKDDMGGTAANRLTSGGSGVNGASLGAAGGGESVTLTSAQIPSHNHYDGHGVKGDISVAFGTTGSVASVTERTSLSGGYPYTSSTGSGGAHANIPPALVANYIIKT